MPDDKIVTIETRTFFMVSRRFNAMKKRGAFNEMVLADLNFELEFLIGSTECVALRQSCIQISGRIEDQIAWLRSAEAV